jgi:hypothetical protein
MTSVRVYHVGSANSISIAVAAQNGAGLQISARDDNWLGHGVYCWEDLTWAERWYSKRWVTRKEEPDGLILTAKANLDLLLDLTNRQDAALFKEEALLSLDAIPNRRTRQAANNRQRQQFLLDCQVAKSVQGRLQGSRKCGLRMPFHLGPSLTTEGNFYTDQHLQICLWDPSILQDLQLVPLQLDRLTLGS